MGELVTLFEQNDGHSGSGSGPEDPMLERRVDTLEADMKDVKASLQRLEFGFARIEEKFSYLATKEDLARSEQKVLNVIAQVESKLGGELTRVEIKLSNEIARVETTLRSEIARVENKLGGEIAQTQISLGREIAEVKGRVTNLPTLWTQLSIVFATWGIGSGILIFALTRLLAK